MAHGKVGKPPVPGRASTVEQLTERLRELQAWSGMSYRTIHRELVRSRKDRGVPELPVLNTVYRCFQPGRARLDVDLVVDIARLLLGGDEAAEETVESWRNACWLVARITSAAAIVSVTDTWPADLASFTGRQAELDRIVGHGATNWVITGMPGVGKTKLAVRAGHLFTARGRYGEVRLAVDLRGYDTDQPPADPNAVLEGFLRRLGVPSDQIQHQSLAERAARFRRLLAGRDALVLLDNAASAEQVRPLVAEEPGCVVLITSRRALRDLPAAPLPLDVLSPGEAIGLLRRATGGDLVDAEPGIAAEIATLLGHLPLALTLVAGRIRTNPDWTLADHLERLQHHRDSLRLDSGVEVAISLSYRELSAEQKRVFRFLALHPGIDLTSHAAAALTGGGFDDAHRHLELLSGVSLLQHPVPDRYRFHDLVRTYAISRAHEEDAAGARRAGLTRLGAYYLHHAGLAMDLVYPHERGRRPPVAKPATPVLELPDPATARAWLDTERANVLAVAAHLANEHSAVGLAVEAFSPIMHRHLAVTGDYGNGRQLHEQVISAARRSGNTAGEVRALINLGELDVRTGQYDEAIDHMQLALDRADGLGPDEVARALRYLGLANQMTGRYDRAIDYHQRAVTLCREAGDGLGEASGLGNIGVIHQLAGRYEQAADHHRQAMLLFETVGAVEDTARALDHLGLLAQLTGRHEEAAAHHRRALTLFVEAGALEGQATAHDHLGVVDQLAGRYEQAEEHHREALALSRRIGDRDDEARALNNLGVLYRRTVRIEESASCHEQALAIYRELGDPTGLARSLNGFGELALAAGDPARALDAHAEAHLHASKIGQQQEQARACDGLGRAHHELGEPDRAHEQWRQALALYEELGAAEATTIRVRLAASDR